ncbi:hypothetical protein [Gordonia rhizosphera]|uniref:Uncharacterized protein n=1 Tax=Gordonia rhizosphera NBRC 16068 TaxID=1108045 RepID=K6WIH3_9ACTN|nr:hypothetical protein [Gordonia rhizosphera]GAB93591.1 hypothetical protein GORHZ_233_00020 [Gordonia rhizosphera NBRC 16068]
MDRFEYEFVIDGELSERVLSCFPELAVSIDRQHTSTRLSGELPDAAAARGIIARLDDLGLTLREFRRLP